jgi:spore coat-associated protein N
MPLRIAAVVLLALACSVPLAGAGETAELTRRGPRLISSKRGAILTGRRLAPGDRRSGVVTITNRGTPARSFRLTGLVRGSKQLARHLRLTVRERRRGRNPVVYSGTLAGLRVVRLGGIKAGQARTFEFSVSLNPTAPNALQGRRTSAAFTWTAIQLS